MCSQTPALVSICQHVAEGWQRFTGSAYSAEQVNSLLLRGAVNDLHPSKQLIGT